MDVLSRFNDSIDRGLRKAASFLVPAIIPKRPTLTLQRRQISEIVKNNTAQYPAYDIAENSARYCSTDDIHAIIKLLASTTALIPVFCYEIKKDPIGQKAFKGLRMLTPKSESRLHKAYQIKALEDLPEVDPVVTLLENPNDYQSKFEFFEFAYIQLKCFGECFIYKECPEEGVNKGKPTSLHLLDPQGVNILVTNTYPQYIDGYEYVVSGQRILENVPINKVIHIKYPNPSYSYNGTELRGLSPLKVLSKRLVRMDSNLDAAVSQMQNGGVPGIVWDKDTTDTAPDIIGQRKVAYSEYARNNNNKGAPYFASGEMGYIALGLKLADMESADLEKIDFKKLCNVFGISDILFNNSEAATESNVKEQIKRMYTNSCLPDAFRMRDALIKGLLPDFKDKRRFIAVDISEIPELQENYGDLAKWLKESWWITPNEKREMMKFDRHDDTAFDEPLIPTGLQLVSDLTPINDLILPDNG